MKYELTFLLENKEELKNLKDLLSQNGAVVEKEEDWGEKTLSFRIKKAVHAHFYNYTISIEKTKVTELRKKLNFNEKLMRYLLLVQE